MEMKNAGHVTSALLLAVVFSAQAHSQTPGQNIIVVDHPWARATPAGANTGAVYVTLINNGSTGDRLLSATTPVADKVQFTALPKTTAYRACARCVRLKSHLEPRSRSIREVCTS